jgi:hypothetical protein
MVLNDYMPLHVFELLGPGADFGARFIYKIQDLAGDIAQVLGLDEGGNVYVLISILFDIPHMPICELFKRD